MLTRLAEGYGFIITNDEDLLLTAPASKTLIATINKTYKGAPFKASVNGNSVQNLRTSLKAAREGQV